MQFVFKPLELQAFICYIIPLNTLQEHGEVKRSLVTSGVLSRAHATTLNCKLLKHVEKVYS